MELDDFKKTWEDQPNKEQQQHFSSKLIVKMTQEKYQSKINRIAYPEIIGTLICLMAIIFIGLHFYKLDSLYFKCVGSLSILVLSAISIISFLSIQKLNVVKDFSKPFAETIKIFAIQKLAFYKLQKINMLLSYLLLVTIIILLPKFFSGKDIIKSNYFWTISLSFGYIYLLYFSKYVTKSYKNTLTKTTELLRDIES